MAAEIYIKTAEELYGKSSEYLSRQEIFKAESQKIIEIAVERIKNSICSADFKPGLLFWDLLDTFAKERQRIAQQAGTPEAQLFGRESTDLDSGGFYDTSLVGAYAKANELAIKQLAAEMRPMKPSLKEFPNRTRKVEEEVQGRHFSFNIEILEPNLVQKYTHDIPFEEQCKLKTEILQEFSSKPTGFQIIKRMKEKRPDLYKHTRMYYYVTKVFESFPRPQVDMEKREIISGNVANLKSDFILVTKRSEINGKMYATSQWLTWAYKDYTRNPLDRMLLPEYRPTATVLHQDVFLREDALKECEKIFTNIMKWDCKTSSISNLKDQVALLRYIFAEALPYIRGSAAIGEWLEGAIYGAFDKTCTYHPSYTKESVDLVAISTLKYSDYLHRYHDLVHVSP